MFVINLVHLYANWAICPHANPHSGDLVRNARILHSSGFTIGRKEPLVDESTWYHHIKASGFVVQSLSITPCAAVSATQPIMLILLHSIFIMGKYVSPP